MFEKLMDYVAGGTVGKVIDLVRDHWPPTLSDKDKLEIELAAQKMDNENLIQRAKQAHEITVEFNQRIKDMEGTAADLKALPILGPILIFIRGAQRPVWGIFTLYADFMVFAKEWVLDERQNTILLVINALVLTFLFGERAIKNVLPLLAGYFKPRIMTPQFEPDERDM